MSLLVWLPLNGDLHNQGLSDITVTNSGATVNDNGKIGKCYSFDGNGHYLQLSQSLGNIYAGDFTWALWLKSTDDTRSVLISDYNSGPGSAHVTFELYTNRQVRVYWNGEVDWRPTYYVPKDIWTYIAVTRKGDLLTLYVNGEYYASNNSPLTNKDASNPLRIGDDYRGGATVSYMGYMNDIRIYNHCLSPKEVKEIAKGLMVHYTMDVSANIDMSAHTLYDYSIQDVSGFGNNAEMMGFTDASHVSSDTRRYQKSLLFDTNTYIVSDKKANEFLPHDELTVNIWIKCTQWASPLSCTQYGGFGFGKSNTTNEICFYVRDASSGSYKIPTSKVPASAILNGWHMLTGTYNKNTANIYIDGVLKGSVAVGNTGGIQYNTTNYLCIAAEAGGGATPENKLYCGNISDVRIYSTSLSADDVAELYNTAAVTDKQGNFHCYEAIEDGAASITKTGIAKFNIDERDRGSGVTIYSTVQPNLLLGTRRDNVRYEVTGATTEIGLRLTPAVQLQINKKYTFSAMIRGFANMRLYTLNSGGSAAVPNQSFGYISKSEMSAQDFKLFSLTFKVTKDVTSIDQIYPCTKYGPANTQVGDWFEIQADSIKLEEGEMCTPWIPDANDNEYRSYDNLLSTAQLIEK